MIVLNWTSSYKKSFKKITKNDPTLKDKIIATMNMLQEDPFHPKLKTHKLKGILEGIWACSIEYDTRIIFDFVKNQSSDKTEILLINIGTHDEVY
ncbi:MAG TPA: type II toxin-antitoxin system mRNA interferase toxin, RelE/StbE family [Ignavibacteriaceae bacterium]|nr:type II toxin-antitoxin system mRNA interferase toxin, RelE/StbE family [Ignavibacteriaceae bacterium]